MPAWPPCRRVRWSVTSSLRRVALLRAVRPDLKIEPLRGNLDTRLRKLDEGQYDAIVLAAAGLKRLGLQDRIRAVFEPGQMLPACRQGALGIEVRSARQDVMQALAPLVHADTWVARGRRAGGEPGHGRQLLPCRWLPMLPCRVANCTSMPPGATLKVAWPWCMPRPAQP